MTRLLGPLPSDVIETAAELTGFSVEDLRGPSRMRRLVEARHLAWWACREVGASCQEIAAAFDVDHTSVAAAVAKVAGDVVRLRLAKVVAHTVQQRHTHWPERQLSLERES